jgi:hypothetical protein
MRILNGFLTHAALLYGVVSEQLLTFLARRQERDRPVRRFVEREFRDYLTCGNRIARFRKFSLRRLERAGIVLP